MAVVIGGVIIIWLGLTMGAAGLRWLGVELHYPARLAAPVLLAGWKRYCSCCLFPARSCCRQAGAGPWRAVWWPRPG